MMLLPLLLVQVAAAPPAPAASASATVHVQRHWEVVQFFADYFRAVEKGDPDGILALIDDDFVLKWPAGQPIRDRTRLAAALTSMQQSTQQTVEWQVLETHVHGDWAWARVAEKATHSPKAGGPSRTLEGSHLTILRRVRGRWLIHRDYGSLNELPARR